MPEGRETLLALFEDSRGLTDAVRALVDKGHDEFEALSPTPVHELRDLAPGRPSSVRWFTLAGCVAGAAFGFGLQIMTALQWPIIVGGKPVLSMPAFVVIAFEMTILFGALATMAGLMLNARLPQIGREFYHEGCSQSEFALIVKCRPDERASIENLMREAGATDVQAAAAKSVLLGAD